MATSPNARVSALDVGLDWRVWVPCVGMAFWNDLLPRFLGPLFNQHRYGEAFWLITACPAVGVAVWLLLSRGDALPFPRATAA